MQQRIKKHDTITFLTDKFTLTGECKKVHTTYIEVETKNKEVHVGEKGILTVRWNVGYKFILKVNGKPYLGFQNLYKA